MLKVHRCKSLSNWVPEKVTSLSLNKTNTLLAVGRDDRIEIWDCKTYVMRSILLQKEFNVTSVAWLGDRLFSTGFQGYIHEWNITELKEFRFYDTLGGPGLQIASNNQETRIAVSCQDGSVNIYDIAEKDLVYFGKLYSPALEFPALCLSWHPDGNQIVVSNVHTISVYNVAKKEQLVHIDLPKRTEALVISFLPDYTIVIGANLGHTMFYDGQLGTPISSFKEHQSMVLALTTTNNGKDVFTSGVDSSICFYSFDEKKKIWSYRSKQRPLERDVYALANFDDWIISAGVDLEIAFSSLQNFHILGVQTIPEMNPTLKPYPQIPSSLASLAHKKKVVLCNQPFSLELWGLHQDTRVVEDKPFSYEVHSPHLLSIQILGDDPIVCSSISPCGKYVCYSTCKTTKLYSIIYTDDAENVSKEIKIRRVDLPPMGFSQRVMFSLDSSKLILVSHKLVITIIDLLTHQSERLEKHIDQNIQPVLGLDISPDGRWLIIGDSINRIHLYDLKTLEVSQLPHFSSQHTCLKFSPSNLLAITTAENQVFFLKDGQFTAWTLKNRDMLPNILKTYRPMRNSIDLILGISFNPQNDQEVILWTSQNTITINLSANFTPKRKAVGNKNKKPKKKGPAFNLLRQALYGNNKISEKEDEVSGGFRISSHFSGIMLLDFLESGEMVALERSPYDVGLSLPPPFDRKIFGLS